MPILFSISAIDVFDQSMECDVVHLIPKLMDCKMHYGRKRTMGRPKKKERKRKWCRLNIKARLRNLYILNLPFLSLFWRIEIFCDQIEFPHSDIDLDFASYSPSVIPSKFYYSAKLYSWKRRKKRNKVFYINTCSNRWRLAFPFWHFLSLDVIQ